MYVSLVTVAQRWGFQLLKYHAEALDCIASCIYFILVSLKACSHTVSASEWKKNANFAYCNNFNFDYILTDTLPICLQNYKEEDLGGREH